MRYLPQLFASLDEQTFRDFSVLVIDNASTDGVAEYIREHHPSITVLRNFRNLGFSAAHNQGIRYALAAARGQSLDMRYVLVTNPDTILSPHALERLVAAADAGQTVASWAPKLLRAERVGEGALEETVVSRIIDSTGIQISRSRRVVDRGAGEEDHGQYDSEREVFGVSGALALYRASALEMVRMGDQYFDEDFFAYQEDVDVAWRLRLAGFAAAIVPEAVAYHFRTASGADRSGPLGWLKNRRNKSAMVNYLSHRNHGFLFLKDDFLRNILLHLPWILAYEVGKLGAVILFEPKTLRAIPAFFALVPRMLGKRGTIMRTARVKPSDIRTWFH